MKLKLLLIGLFFVSFSIHAQDYKLMMEDNSFSVQEVIDAGEAYFAGKDKGRGTGYKQFKRWEYMAKRLMNENGHLPTVKERINKLQEYNAYLNNTASSRSILADNWQDLGPTSYNATSGYNPGVGRVTAVAVDPIDNNIIIIGANTGGVWKTIDGGQNWIPLHDNFVNLFVYSVAIDPLDPTVYYFGSNSGLIYKSTDSGATWNELAVIADSVVNKILIHPTLTNIMFASVQSRGTYRSIDGGLNWIEVTNDSRSYDIEFKADDPSVVFASGSAYHKSIDGGATFTTMNNGFGSGPKMIGVSPDDASTIYVLQAQNGGFGGLFKSVDNGDTFTQLNHSGRNYLNLSEDGTGGGGQAPRDMDIAISPTDIDEVHLGGGQTWRSMDGGISFELSSFWFIPSVPSLNVGYCHADVDILQFFGDTMYAGTDGGVFKASNTSGAISTSYFENLSDGLSIHQFYKIGVAQSTNEVVTGGTQDNGTSLLAGTNGWRHWMGADGGGGFIATGNDNIGYGTVQFGGVVKTTDQGLSRVSANNPPGDGVFVTPFQPDPEVTNTVYIGYDNVYKSTNGAISWSSISQTIGAIDELEIARSNSQVIYASTSNGTRLYRTRDGGATNFVRVANPGTGSDNNIIGIAVHPTNPDLIAAAVNSDNTSSKVRISRDGGDTWENAGTNLPNFSAIAVVWDNHANEGLYVGMNYGVFYIDNSFSEWQPYSNLLPNVIINELEINYVTDMLYAASYGRGLWKTPVVAPVLGVNENDISSVVSVYPNPAENLVSIAFATPLKTEIRIFDVTGKLLIFENKKELTNTHTIDISTLQSGVYFVRLNSEKGTFTKKIIKN